MSTKWDSTKSLFVVPGKANLKAGIKKFNEICKSMGITTIFMNSEKTSSPHSLALNLIDKMT